MKAFRTAVSSLKSKSLVGTYTFQLSSLGSDVDFPYPSGWESHTKSHWDGVFASLGSDLKAAQNCQGLSVTQETLRQMFTRLSKGLAHRAPQDVTVHKPESTDPSYKGHVTLVPRLDGVYATFRIPCPPADGKKEFTEDREIRIVIPGTCGSLPP